MAHSDIKESPWMDHLQVRLWAENYYAFVANKQQGYSAQCKDWNTLQTYGAWFIQQRQLRQRLSILLTRDNVAMLGSRSLDLVQFRYIIIRFVIFWSGLSLKLYKSQKNRLGKVSLKVPGTVCALVGRSHKNPNEYFYRITTRVAMCCCWLKATGKIWSGETGETVLLNMRSLCCTL